MPNTSRKIANGRLYAGKTPDERQTERREKLIEAGIQIIGTCGYQNTSVKAVCTQAGLTERYFYENFSNREDLLAEVCRYLGTVTRQQVREAIMSAPPEIGELARAGARCWFRILRDDPRIARILLFEGLGASPRLREINRENEAEQVALMREAIARYRSSPAINKDRENLIIAGLIGAGVNIAIRWVLGGYRESLEDVVESQVLIHETVTHRAEEIIQNAGKANTDNKPVPGNH